jgi:hypothetical protein
MAMARYRWTMRSKNSRSPRSRDLMTRSMYDSASASASANFTRGSNMRLLRRDALCDYLLNVSGHSTVLNSQARVSRPLVGIAREVGDEIALGCVGLQLLWLDLSPALGKLNRMNAEINARATYRYYEAKDFRYLKPGIQGQEGNCAAFAWTKLLDLNRAGYSPVLRECTLTTGEPHVFIEVNRMVLLNQRDELIPLDEMNCEEPRGSKSSRRPPGRFTSACRACLPR